jgi:tetratricopeptide (TPR) repeat protein
VLALLGAPTWLQAASVEPSLLSPAGVTRAETRRGSAREVEVVHDAIGASRLEDEGDRAWARRAVGATPDHVPREAAIEAVDSYRKALSLQPERLELRVKLLRAIVFLAEYATPREEDRRPYFEEGREIFAAGYDQLEQRAGRPLDKVEPQDLPGLLGSVPEAGALYFYGALHWGLWGRYFGKMASLRKGVAKRIRDLGEAAIALDPKFDSGGGYRLVGRLHAEAPKVPFVTGWVSRNLAMSYLQQALEVGPNEPLNRLFLAEAYLEFDRDMAKARKLLEEAKGMKPRADRQLEDLKALSDVSALLSSLAA